MRFTLLFSFAALVICGSLQAQEVRPADTLTPEDFGATKFVFEATAREGEVVVFRQDEYRDDGKLRNRFEGISNPTKLGEKHMEYVLLINRGFFAGQDLSGPYVIRTRSGTVNVEASRLGSTQFNNPDKGSGKPAQATIVFETVKDGKNLKRTFIYSIFVEPYASVKQRHPKLPDDLSHGWGYSSYVKP